MKKSTLAILITALVLLSVIIWMFQTGFSGKAAEIVQFGIVLLVIAFGFYTGVRRLKSERRGEPAEDELSRRMLRRASSRAYYISLYTWLVMLYLSEEKGIPGHILITAGILSMAVIFAGCWLYLKIRGIRDE